MTKSASSILVSLHGELDLATVPEVQRRLTGVAIDRRAVVVDLRGLGFIDSSGIRLLVELQRLATEHRFFLAVLNGGPTVRRALELSGVAAHLNLIDDPPDGDRWSALDQSREA